MIQQSRLFNLPMKTAVGGPGDGDLPMAKGFLEVEDPRVELTAVKKGEWDDSLVLRLVNRTDEDVSTAVVLDAAAASAERINMKETESLGALVVEGSRIPVDIPAKKILTVKVVP